MKGVCRIPLPELEEAMEVANEAADADWDNTEDK
jgi:hypothetical protein